jgi:hypothetical protein
VSVFHGNEFTLQFRLCQAFSVICCMDKQRIRNIGREFFKKGLPKIGESLIKIAGAAAARTPAGSVLKEIGVFDAVADALGIDSSDEKAIEETVKEMTEDQLNSLVELKQLETNIAIEEIERENVIDTEDTKRIESVNETMRAEVLGNPKAAEWRPLWGRWTCYNFFPIVYLLVATFIYAVISGDYQVITQIPVIVGAFSSLFILPAAILGVASYKRGLEKIELAKSYNKDNEES